MPNLIATPYATLNNGDTFLTDKAQFAQGIYNIKHNGGGYIQSPGGSSGPDLAGDTPVFPVSVVAKISTP